MDLVRELISTGRFVREETKIKVRQPISEALIDGKYENILGDLVSLINEELNVGLYSEVLKNLSIEDEEALLKEETITIDFDGERLDITPNMVDVRIEAKDGFNVGMENNKFIILNTELTRELLLEGLAREFVSKVQNLRKTSGLNIEDRIKLYYHGDNEVNDALTMFKDYVKEETLATTYEEKEVGEAIEINGHNVTILIEKSE